MHRPGRAGFEAWPGRASFEAWPLLFIEIDW